jgi:hypothetical protein
LKNAQTTEARKTATIAMSTGVPSVAAVRL